MKYDRPILAAFAAAVFGVMVPVAQDGVVFKDPASEALFRAARSAVGHGEGKVVGLQSLVLKGRSKVVVGDGEPVDALVEIKVLLPDHYLRVDSAGTSRMATGFAGKKLLTAMADGAQRSAPPQNLHDGLLKLEQARLARLLLGATTYVSTDYFITFRSTGSVQAMTGPLDGSGGSLLAVTSPVDNVIEGAGRDGFFVRLSLSTTKLPVKLEYRVSRDRMNTVAFSDRRDVDGLLIPFRITTTDGKRTIDDLFLEQVLVNPPLAAPDFGLAAGS